MRRKTLSDSGKRMSGSSTSFKKTELVILSELETIARRDAQARVRRQSTWMNGFELGAFMIPQGMLCSDRVAITFSRAW